MCRNKPKLLQMATQNQKEKVLNQFIELKQKLTSKKTHLVSELDVIIDTIVDLANRHVPNLSSIIDSLKSLEKERSYLPNVIAFKEKYNKTLLDLNQIIKHIEDNGLPATPENHIVSPERQTPEPPMKSNFFSSLTNDQLITLIIFVLGAVFTAGWYASDMGHKIDEQEFKRTIEKHQDSISILKRDLSRVAPSNNPTDIKSDSQKGVDKK